MERTIKRTFNIHTITIKEGKDGKELKQPYNVISSSEPDRKKIAIDFIKETGNTNFYIDIQSREEVREIPFDTFLKYSTVVEPKQTEENKGVK